MESRKPTGPSKRQENRRLPTAQQMQAYAEDARARWNEKRRNTRGGKGKGGGGGGGSGGGASNVTAGPPYPHAWWRGRQLSGRGAEAKAQGIGLRIGGGGRQAGKERRAARAHFAPRMLTFPASRLPVAAPWGQFPTQLMMQGKSDGAHATVKHLSAHIIEVICETARGSISSARRALRRATMLKCLRRGSAKCSGAGSRWCARTTPKC
ncbi:unnamed protein product [Prorocentrum cordatum]|uniref:Uncharacterized protein n=1 Tax=Prorocentrum cordatum TaxID=2364126 RepID=A0ABN9PMZ5_9DINO|nr:unnamed protein product [Polarella glacialis]